MAVLSMSSSTLMQNSSRKTVKAAINIPTRVGNISIPIIRPGGFIREQMGLKKMDLNTNLTNNKSRDDVSDAAAVVKLYAILEEVSDRVEMHRNIGEQRNNWNALLLTSINSITLAAAVMAGIAAASDGSTALAMKISSTAMYVAATGMLAVVNKIQPSQLAEEQRNAVRLLKQIQRQIQTLLSIGKPTAADVEETMEKVLALDRAYPLPLLGKMLDKFPAAVEPAVWWPEKKRRLRRGIHGVSNGWTRNLEDEMCALVRVMKIKDREDYLRLGAKALNLNKFLAIAGPLLTGFAAIGSAAHGDGAVFVSVMGGALASVVNMVSHGGQVGMVFEMYRNNAGFFQMMEEMIEGNLEEEELERRENGELLEMKVALRLGRSLSELRDLAAVAAGAVKGEAVDEFASKLF